MTLLLDKYTKKDDEEGDFVDIALENLREYGLNTLQNMGNTCYFNTANQLLIVCIRELTLYFLNGEFKHDFNIEDPKDQVEMSLQYYKIVKALWEDPLDKVITVRPTSFKKVFDYFYPQFKGYGQHDCQESLSALIDLLHTGLSYGVEILTTGVVKTEKDKLAVEAIKEWNLFYGKEYSILVKLLYGQDHTRLKCLSCGNQQHKFEPFNVITLPIPDKPDGRNTTIYDCLDEYTKDEKLEESCYSCSKCGDKENMTKETTFWSFHESEYLILSLKRFSAMSGIRKKDDLVEFPIEGLDISEYISGYKTRCVYDLVGVGNHISSHMSSGHYYAVCKHLDNEWYHLNDSVRTKLRIPKIYTVGMPHVIINKNAYILVYKRR